MMKNNLESIERQSRGLNDEK